MKKSKAELESWYIENILMIWTGEEQQLQEFLLTFSTSNKTSTGILSILAAKKAKISSNQ